MSTSSSGENATGIPTRIQERLKDCVSHHHVTIVCGKTGCGKSTRVPPYLLDTLGGPILCTQPRRLAVVAVATRVAQERGVALGGQEVGYHVGQSNHSLSSTNLIFTTAGILLEELRANGIAALTKYKAVILDECHERSPEQELCLSMCKLYLLQKQQRKNQQDKIRLVLMSATFDHARYRSYFAGLDTPIDLITLETANQVDAHYERVETLYLEDIVSLMTHDDTMKHSRFLNSMRIDPDEELQGEDGGKSLSLNLLNFVRSLVIQLDREEPISGVFMIFAPTYRHLEQIYDMIHAALSVGMHNTHPWKVGVLHSSMDMEDCLQNMQPPTDSKEWQHNRFRKILLCSAIADSSVTVPGVSCVIDLCRALRVQWTPNNSYVAKTLWASQSICNQRQGRTGRTCPGRCFRLVSKGYFVGRLEPWEEPLLAMSSCRNEVLKLLCSASSASSSTDPVQVLNKCLDPPPPAVVEDAFVYLQSIGACVALGKKRTFVPTKMGDLLAALPFAVEDSQVIVAGAQVGLLHETLALKAIMSHKPNPIVHHFGDQAVNDANILCYYDQAPIGSSESVNMANLSAFLYWDISWNQFRTKASVEQFAVATGAATHTTSELADFATTQVDATKPCGNVWKWCPSLEDKHTQWCRARGINPTSVRGVAELMDTALSVFYVAALEPEWLRAADPTPLWRRFRDWKGRQLNDYVVTKDVLAMVYDFHGEQRLSKVLMALNDGPGRAIGEMSKEDILEVASLPSNKPVQHINRQVKLPPACVHFLEGNCMYGDKCKNSHSPYAQRPMCKFFFKGGCNRGANCVFSHVDAAVPVVVSAEHANLKKDPLTSLAPTMPELYLPDDLFDWFSQRHGGLFLLGDGNFDFTRSLSTLGIGARVASDISATATLIGATVVLPHLDATRLHVSDIATRTIHEKRIDTFHWNFPFTGDEEHDEGNESLVLGTFHSLHEFLRRAVHTRQDLEMFTLSLTLQGDQFSRWNVLKSAMRTRWRLRSWGCFNLDDFPGYKPRRADGKVFPASEIRFYEFNLRRDDLSGNYS
ncbi:Probable ATP-dependent RNA helicase spindle-E [Seminavis robusta]|uniref:Probable ATP-dependent RNA helicase spindle-E n=1 Tax=Seminavis robusta TaxID=568900 RepID=A0A9N8EBW2_9STRA|nr:Probable ATP-dependent RNA helicase spindle-E [Seminavis robusta]|eukprot:Sro944_g222900.1 Probable ATP-dependent RNA helicase spindle-E (1041) ;mRNA; r:9513-12635